jgi:hypothetical protein
MTVPETKEEVGELGEEMVVDTAVETLEALETEDETTEVLLALLVNDGPVDSLTVVVEVMIEELDEESDEAPDVELSPEIWKKWDSWTCVGSLSRTICQP